MLTTKVVFWKLFLLTLLSSTRPGEHGLAATPSQLPSSPLLSQTCHQHWEWPVHNLEFSFFMDVKNLGKLSLCVSVLQVQAETQEALSTRQLKK